MNKYILFIFDEMHRQHMSMTELSERSGVSVSLLCHYFAGTRNPGLKNFSKLIDALGYEIVYKKKEIKI